MNQDTSKLIVRNLELLVDGLKAEVYTIQVLTWIKEKTLTIQHIITKQTTTRYSTMTTGIPTERARKYMKLLRRLVKQEHLCSEKN